MEQDNNILTHDEKAQAEEMQLRSAVYEWVESAVFALICVTVIFSFFFRVIGVSGNSMLNTLHNGDRLLMVNAFYEPNYGDIIIVRRDHEEPIVKRIIAMAGDTISIDPNQHVVYLNGKLLDEPYLDFPTPPLYNFTGPYTVPEGTVFVMGDNRPDSHDSRADDIGAVKLDHIMGKAVFRIWPISQFGTIDERNK